MIIIGLDNGILMKAKNKKGTEFLQDNFDGCKCDWTSDKSIYELNYMRKNWGIRNDIINNYFGGDRLNIDNFNEFDGDYPIKLDINHIEDLVQIFAYYLDEKHWRDDAGSIWEWHEGISGIAKTIYNLRRLEEALEYEEISADDIEIWFYDSY